MAGQQPIRARAGLIRERRAPPLSHPPTLTDIWVTRYWRPRDGICRVWRAGNAEVMRAAPDVVAMCFRDDCDAMRQRLRDGGSCRHALTVADPAPRMRLEKARNSLLAAGLKLGLIFGALSGSFIPFRFIYRIKEREVNLAVTDLRYSTQ